MRGINRKYQGLHGRLTSLQTKITNLKKLLWSAREQGESDDRDAFESYLFRMQVCRQHDEFAESNDTIKHGQRQMRSRQSAHKVKPWYRDNKLRRNENHPQARSRTSKRSFIRARLLEITSSTQIYRTSKHRNRRSNCRKGHFYFLISALHNKRDSSELFSFCKEKDGGGNAESAEHWEPNWSRSPDTMSLNIRNTEAIADSNITHMLSEARKKSRQSSTWKRRFSNCP